MEFITYLQAKTKIKSLETKAFNFVVPLGFEPRAAGLENLCSIQLSYGTKCKNESAKVEKEII